MYNKRKIWQCYRAELKRLSKELVAGKKKRLRKHFYVRSYKNEGRCWTEFYKYIKHRKGNRGNIPAIKDYNGKLITNSLEKASSHKSYYASLFSCERNNPQIKSTQSGKPFTISISIIRKRLSVIGRKKSVGPDGIPEEILKLGGKAMIPYFVRLLVITMNNNPIPVTGKKL